LNQKTEEQQAKITSIQYSNKQLKEKLSDESINFLKLQKRLIETKELSEQTIKTIQNENQNLKDQLNKKHNMATNQITLIENLNQKNQEQSDLIKLLRDDKTNQKPRSNQSPDNLYLADSLNGCFNSGQASNMQNPLSSCPIYACDGRGIFNIFYLTYFDVRYSSF
jgi:hypothetical protein